jgi:RNA polymerase sigma-70 factor (ECF subfamily)
MTQRAGSSYTRVTLDQHALAQLYRAHSGAIVARLIRVASGDFALAEEAVQEAFSAALVQWPSEGTPPNPRAWLIRTAHNKAIDRLRRRARFESPLDPELAAALAADGGEADMDPTQIDDDCLRLIFTCCHPALNLDAQVALTLRTLCGLTTEEIARAFMLPTAAMAQRLVRAQNKIKLAKIPYVVPERSELAERVDAVLAVVYLVFSEGYAATRGDALQRRDLCAEAIRLGSLLERLLPEDPAPVALLSLMLLHDSRSAAREDERGDVVLLEDQDRSRWNGPAIEAGLERLERALHAGARGSFALQAAIAALHARAASPGETDWAQIALLYERLLRVDASPVVALNHAAAVAMAEGPERGLQLLDGLAGDPAMQHYHLYFAARADLFRRAGRSREAQLEYQRALALVGTEPERRFLNKRLAQLAAAAES